MMTFAKNLPASILLNLNNYFACSFCGSIHFNTSLVDKIILNRGSSLRLTLAKRKKAVKSQDLYIADFGLRNADCKRHSRGAENAEKD